VYTFGRWEIKIVHFEERYRVNRGYKRLAAAIVRGAFRDLYKKPTMRDQTGMICERRALDALFWLAFSPQCAVYLECLNIDVDPLTVFERGLPEKLPRSQRGG
jgi:hypothetical protein